MPPDVVHWAAFAAAILVLTWIAYLFVLLKWLYRHLLIIMLLFLIAMGLALIVTEHRR
jgi:hypothetical protein